MAAPRKSSAQLAAREKALLKAQALTARHETLIEHAAEFFVHQDRAEQVLRDGQAKADAILAQADRDAEGARTDAAKKIQDMLDTGESRAAVASRLGLSGAELKKLTGPPPTPVTATAEAEPAVRDQGPAPAA